MSQRLPVSRVVGCAGKCQVIRFSTTPQDGGRNAKAALIILPLPPNALSAELGVLHPTNDRLTPSDRP